MVIVSAAVASQGSEGGTAANSRGYLNDLYDSWGQNDAAHRIAQINTDHLRREVQQNMMLGVEDCLPIQPQDSMLSAM